MNKSIEDTTLVFIGAGNLATNLAKAFYEKGFRIAQVYSRTLESAKALAEAVEADYTNELSALSTQAQLYIVALKDAVMRDLLPQMVKGREQGMWVHTAGSMPMDVWEGLTPRYGVFYPMQTFSKTRLVAFDEIPIFIESNQQADAQFLTAVAARLSHRVYEATSNQRKSLHLAAVFTCNFTNHLYALSAQLLQKYQLPFDAMLPLIDETARKVHTMSPLDAQTGPAIRYDLNVIHAHLAMLSDEPQMQALYQQLTDSIHRLATEGKH